MESAKPVERPTERPPENPIKQVLDFHVRNYEVKVALHNNKLCLSAYSEAEGRMLEGIIEEKDLAEKDKVVFEDCEGVYLMIEECLQDKRSIQLSDIGDIKFPYFLKSTKKTQVQRNIELRLREVELGESQRIAMKFQRMEAEMRAIKESNTQLQTKVRELEAIAEKGGFSPLEKIVP